MSGKECEGAPSSALVDLQDPVRRHRRTVGTRQILVVDTALSDRVLMEQVLRSAGHVVHPVADPELALDRLADGGMDLVLASTELAGMRGTEFLRHMRVLEAGRDRTPIVLLTADPAVHQERNVLVAGGVRLLAKPPRLEALLRVIEELCARPCAPASNPVAPAVNQRQLLEERGLDQALIERYVQCALEDAAERRRHLEAAMFATQGDAWTEACDALRTIATAINVPPLMAAVDGAAAAMETRERRAALRAIDRALTVLQETPAAAVDVEPELRQPAM